MKANFKPLGLAAAVAAASAGYAGLANAQTFDGDTPAIAPVEALSGPGVVANNAIGDLALVPYYTVQAGFGTGIHVINTSDRTQVVKFRFRRGSDSLDALDFNIIMSPYDEWTGFMNDSDGTIAVTTQDTTCTAPLFEDGRFEMPNIYRDGAEEGYVEVIAMGSPIYENSPVGYFAKHVDGVPRNCQFVEDNFLDAYLGVKTSDPRGVHSNSLTAGLWDTDATDPFAYACDLSDRDADDVPDLCITEYTDGGDFLKVSWFVRDAAAGLEFGNDATYLAGFSTNSMMTHQEQGVFSGNLRGFDFPDLNGSAPFSETNDPFNVGSTYGIDSDLTDWERDTGKFADIRDPGVLGVTSVINDWSNNPDLNVGTDWIVTLPGQYTMLDGPLYFLTLGNSGGLDETQPGGIIGGAVDINGDEIVCGSDYDTAEGTFELPLCDFRDIPVIAEFSVWDREENLAVPPPGDRDVVISPSIPGLPPNATVLRHEVNVVHWGPEVLASDYDEVDVSAFLSLLAPSVSGWAKLNILSNPEKEQQLCEWQNENYTPLETDPNDPMACAPVGGSAPMIGFVAWQRSFPDNPDANYGRAIDHSFESGSLGWVGEVRPSTPL